ncbi:MAG: amidohydrolase family protein [Nanoarchaeota archaeon]|nr:amidohydrolase family protein [Nanoarchaeota archaeon]
MGVFDCHVHLMTKETMTVSPEKQKLRDKHGLPPLELHDLHETGKKWEKELSNAGISKAVFLSFEPNHHANTEFIRKSDKFVGFTAVNPEENSAEQLITDFENGFQGVKLYPASRGFRIDTEKSRKIFNTCNDHAVPVMIHFGITLGHSSNILNANPSHLHAVAKEFSDLNFIIPHFGAGMMREALFLTYHCDNVYFDSSGSNSWMKYLPYDIDLKQVFKKFIDAAGMDKLLFGTDSSFFPRGYRKNLLDLQKKVLDELEVNKSGQRKFFYENINKLLKK